MPRSKATFAALLGKGRWFGSIPASLQEVIVARSVVRSFAKGRYIVREGEAPKAMYAVLKGRVRVTRSIGSERSELVIYVGEPGFWFGDYALLARAPSIGSIIADSDVTVLTLTVREFERIVRDEPQYFRSFADLLFERYADLFRYLGESSGLAAEDWLHTRLVDLARTMRRDNPSADAGVISLSQAQLAAMMGISRQTLSTMLRRLEARGLVQVRYRGIRVLG